MLKVKQLADIKYDKAGEVTERTIIPTFIPKPNIKALDVSTLSESEQQEMLVLIGEYDEYRTAFLSTLFSFEDWINHSRGTTPDVKWRTFKIDHLCDD